MRHQIKSSLHLRQEAAITNFRATLPKRQSDLAGKRLKTPASSTFSALGKRCRCGNWKAIRCMRFGKCCVIFVPMSKRAATISLVSSICASLCCLAPILALFSGASSVAARFSWLEPARPYLIGLSVFCLSFAWYQVLRTQKADNCGCDTPKKSSLLQSKLFLSLVTVCAVLFLTFPSYSKLFSGERRPVGATVSSLNVAVKQVEFRVEGMGCAACEPEVETAVGKLNGVRSVKASCVKKNTVILYDSTQTSTTVLRGAINSTGYTVQNQIR